MFAGTKTTAVADSIGVPYYRIVTLIRNRRIPLPAKDSSGDFVWSPDDIERARQALANPRRRHREAVPA